MIVYQFLKIFLKFSLKNSWNEWGEQMTMEPSNEENFVYLETFMKKLLDNFK